MAKPTVRVRIAFADGPYVASPTWTDVTSYVRAINTSRGRTDDWQNFDSGSATLILDNRDRRFDPTYTSSPYYGNLQPRRQILIDATTDSINYHDVFRGYVDGWPVELTDAGYDSTVTISCYDLLGLIAQTTAPYDWADAYIRSLSAYRYIKFDDLVNTASPSATSFTDYGSAAIPLTYSQGTAVLQNVDSFAPGLPYKAVNMVNELYFRTTNPLTGVSSVSAASWTIPTPVTGSSQYLEAYGPDFTLNNTAGTNMRAYITYGYNLGTAQWEVRLTVQTRIGAGSTQWAYAYPLQVNASTPHHFAFTVTNLTSSPPTVNVVVDGIELAAVSPTTSTLTLAAQDLLNVQRPQQQLVVFGSLLTTAQIATIYNLSIGQVIETTAARFTRAMGQTSVPGALYSAPGSPAGTVAKINHGGEPINTTIQLASDSEGGELYTSKAGVLTMTNRTYYQSGTSATNQATFGAGGIPIGMEASYYWTADGIRNALNLEWSGDTTINVSDATSIAAYGTQQDNYSTQLSTAADTQTLGNLLVGFGKLPRLIMSAVELGQALSTAEWATVLGLELLDRITVVVPEPVGTNLTQKQLIQQIEHEITPGDWRTRILGSSRWSSYFILDESLLDGTDLLA
jgi:hypothetical protein